MTGSELDSNNSHAHLAVTMEGSVEVDKLSKSLGLEQELRRFWDFESIGIVEEPASDMAEAPFLIQIKYDFLQGRYKVGLPWKSTKRTTICVRPG